MLQSVFLYSQRLYAHTLSSIYGPGSAPHLILGQHLPVCQNTTHASELNVT